MKLAPSKSLAFTATMLPDCFERYVSRTRVLLLSGGFAATGLLLVAVSFLTAEENRTVFGTPLGSDFTAMYVAGSLLNEQGASHLYDFERQHEIRGTVLPGLPEWNQLPYLYAPWFAALWKPLAALPYWWACFTWLILNPILFMTGFWLLSRTCTHISRSDMVLALLVGLSFEPFLFETWANGQVSTIPFLAVCLSLWLHKHDRAFLGGMALAVCFYKPTQPLLIVLVLLLGRRWRSLSGMACAGGALAAVTALLFGLEMLIEYPTTLLNYRDWISTDVLELPRAKYVDVKSSSHLLGAPWEIPALVCFGSLAVLMTARLTALWRRASDGWNPASQHAWAVTLLAAPVLNFYFAVYDAIIIIPGLLLAIDLWQTSPASAEGRRNPVLPLAALIYVAGLLIPVNEVLHVDLITYALLFATWRLLSRQTLGLESLEPGTRLTTREPQLLC